MTEDTNIVEQQEERPKGEFLANLTFREMLPDYGVLLVLAGGLIALDQWTKNLVRENIEFGGRWMPWEWLSPYARVVHWRNSGAAFGMFQEGELIFTILAIVVGVLIVYYYPRVPREDWPLKLAMGMQLGGAMGNLVDRLLHDGYVTDWISVGTFPVFNVADSSITLGVAVLMISVWVIEQKERKAKAEAEAMVLEGEEVEEPSGE